MLKLARNVKGNNRGFYTYVTNTIKTTERMEPEIKRKKTQIRPCLKTGCTDFLSMHYVTAFYKEMTGFVNKRTTAEVIYLTFSSPFSTDSHRVLLPN